MEAGTTHVLSVQGLQTVEEYEWSSSDPSVATVDNAGRITAVKAGEAIITISAEGTSASVTVSVRDSRRYSVTIGDELVTVKHGETLSKPADPQKPSTSNYDYVFDKWVIFGTDTAWDFENDVVTGNVDLEPVFIEKAKEYSYTYRIVSATREFLGKNYELYEIKDEDISVVVSFNGEEYSRPAVENGMFTVSGVKGNYDVEITWQGIVTERICRLQTDGQADIEVSKPLEIGGSAGELPSFGQGYEVQGDILKSVSLQIAADCLRVDVTMLNDANRFAVVSFLQVFLRLTLPRGSIP